LGDPGGTVVDRRVEILLDVGSEVFVSDLFGVGFEPFQWRGSEPIPAVAAGGRATDEQDAACEELTARELRIEIRFEQRPWVGERGVVGRVWVGSLSIAAWGRFGCLPVSGRRGVG